MILLIEIKTETSAQIVDITSKVEEAVSKSKVEEGICLVYTFHTTTGIVINEAESGLIQDLLRRIASLAPPEDGYLHDRIDNNAHAHLQAVLLGNSQVIPIEKNRLHLGTWQKILFVELDGPRRRRISTKIIPG
ncbi:MAG: secondary thiamine-phosphate synthase enzyme YjbQ [Methanotrichaceae archaeon]